MAAGERNNGMDGFFEVVKTRTRRETLVALIIDSPWLPGYAGIHTLDFLFEPDDWLAAYLKVRRDLPGVAFIPDLWVEFGMANEPSGFGAAIQWSPDAPPSIRPHPGGLKGLLGAPDPDPERDGLMPVVLRRYERMAPRLKEHGLAPRIAAARGPLAVAAHVMGVTELLIAIKIEPAACLELIERTTQLCIRWLRCQLERMNSPAAVLVLDDLAGMMSPADAARFSVPYLTRIFAAFPGLVHIFHNDSPNKAVYAGLAAAGMDVFNFSHEIDPGEARALVGPDVVLMGNIAPLAVLARGTPADVRREAGKLLARLDRCGPLIISAGGGVSPGTPIENLKALAETVRVGR